MKVTQRILESLIANPADGTAITNSLKQLSELSKHSHTCVIDDWEAFINILHDKRLSYSSEVVAVSILGASILENALVESLGGTSDSKTVLNLLNVLSFKLKSPNDFARKQLSLSYATVYCYLAKEIIPHLQDFNDLHKKIKQRVEEDAKHLVKLLEYCFSQSTLISAKQKSESFTPLLSQFLHELWQLVTQQSNVFKNQSRFLENILLSALELRVVSADTNTIHQLIEEPLLSNVTQLLGSLPRCTSTAAGYPDRVKYFTNKYMNNLQYIFLFFARGVKTEDILSSFNFEDTFSTTPALLFDFKAISEAKRASPRAISDALIERISVIQNLLEEMFSQIRFDSVQCWNVGGFFKMIETILNLDAKHLVTISAPSAKSAASFFDEGLLETDKVVLPKEEYLRVSVAAKVTALKILQCLCEVIGNGLTKHVEWVYDALYFVSVNFEGNNHITAALFANVSEILKQTGSLVFEFTEYLFFQSPIKPLQLIVDHFTSAKASSSIENEDQLIDSILTCLKIYLKTCGRLQTKPELVGEIDAVVTAVISNHSNVISSKHSETILECLEASLNSNSLKFEESLLLPEITRFLNQLHQSKKVDVNTLRKAQSLRRFSFFACQSKRTSFIDGTQDLTTFTASRARAAEEIANIETSAEEEHVNKNIEGPINEEETWGNQTHNDESMSLKRTFTQLMRGTSEEQELELNQKKMKVEKSNPILASD